MKYSKAHEASKKLQELQGQFKLQLSKKVTDIADLWQDLLSESGKYEDLDNMLRMSHSLAGSGGTFGAVAVGTIAHELELILQPLSVEQNLPDQSDRPSVNDSTQQQVEQLLAQISQTAEDWNPSSVPYLKPVSNNEPRDNDLIFVADDDELSPTIATIIKNICQPHQVLRS